MKRLRQITAILGIVLLLGMYISTLIFAILDLPDKQGLLMASIYCTVAVPILLFAMGLVAKVLRERTEDSMK